MYYIRQILWLLVSEIILSTSTALASEIKSIQMKIGDKEYSVVLNDNNTTKALKEILALRQKSRVNDGEVSCLSLRRR